MSNNLRPSSLFSRLFSEGKAARRKRLYRHGPPVKESHQLSMAALARAETRIIGSSRTGTQRDMAISALRVVTLLGAVLLPTLEQTMSDPPAPPAPPPGLQPGALTVSNDISAPPTNINLSTNSSGSAASGDLTSRLVINNMRPVSIKAQAKLALNMDQTYWYRTELGHEDVFWALPEEDFHIRVTVDEDARTGCVSGLVHDGERYCGVVLDFIYGSNEVTGVDDRVNFDVSEAEQHGGDCKAAPELDASGRSREVVSCTLKSGNEDIVVSVRRALTPAQCPNRFTENEEDCPAEIAFEIRWQPVP